MGPSSGGGGRGARLKAETRQRRHSGRAPSQPMAEDLQVVELKRHQLSERTSLAEPESAFEQIEDAEFRFGSFVEVDCDGDKQSQKDRQAVSTACAHACSDGHFEYNEEAGTWDVVVVRTFIELIRRVDDGHATGSLCGSAGARRGSSAPAKLLDDNLSFKTCGTPRKKAASIPTADQENGVTSEAEKRISNADLAHGALAFEVGAQHTDARSGATATNSIESTCDRPAEEKPNVPKASKCSKKRKKRKAAGCEVAPLVDKEGSKGHSCVEGVSPQEPARAAMDDLVECVSQARRRELKARYSAVFREKNSADVRTVRETLRNGAKNVGTITLEELARFGQRSVRRLVSIYGDIFDVTYARDFQHPGGAKCDFAGKDITWGLILGMPTSDNCNRFYDVFKGPAGAERRLPVIYNWHSRYESECGLPVGRLASWDREEDLPPPPLSEQEGVCTVQ